MKPNGERIDGLKIEDFEVTDDGRPRTLSFFSQGSDTKTPLALVLLTDLNLHPMNDLQILRLRAALRRALWESLRTNDQVAVITLIPHFAILRTLGHSRQSVLESLTPSLWSPEEAQTKETVPDIISALLAAVRHVYAQRQHFRLEFVVVSEKSYGALQHNSGSSMEQLLASGAVINRIAPSRLATDVLDYVCEQTGGEVVHLRGKDYSEALERVIKNVSQRYSMGFIPDNDVLDRRFHNLGVSVRVPTKFSSHRTFEVRARRGYFSVPRAGAIKP